MDTSNIIDAIHERTTNIEHATISTTKRHILERGIKELGMKEKQLRESTITITHASKAEEIMREIESKWIEEHKAAPVTYWQDKEKLFVQFKDQDTKYEFLKLYSDKDQFIITTPGHIVEPANKITKHHFERKLVKCTFDNVRPTISAQRIAHIIASSVKGTNMTISPITEGKPHANNKHRSILFRMNGNALATLLNQGGIQYNHLEQKIKQRLNIKINCRPWQCRDCFAFGRHDCKGRKCANCGNTGHQTNECTSKKRYCPNCRKPGHKAKDSHCETYMAEVFKELRKTDLPLDYLNEADKRGRLISHLLY